MTASDSQNLIRFEEVSFSYGEGYAIQDLTFAVAKGSFVALLGPNGSGKSTALKIAAGLLSPSEGRARFQGEEVSLLSRRMLARNMAILSQETHLEFDFTVGELVLMGRIPHLGPLAWETKRDKDIATEAMKETGVFPLAGRSALDVSGGERQMSLIAMALAQQPDIFLLDEPCNHLDVKNQFEVMELLKRLNRDRGMTILLCSHDLNLAAAYCDRILLLKNGRLAAEGAPVAVLTEETIQQVYGIQARCIDNMITGTPHLLMAPSTLPTEQFP